MKNTNLIRVALLFGLLCIIMFGNKVNASDTYRVNSTVSDANLPQMMKTSQGALEDANTTAFKDAVQNAIKNSVFTGHDVQVMADTVEEYDGIIDAEAVVMNSNCTCEISYNTKTKECEVTPGDTLQGEGVGLLNTDVIPEQLSVSMIQNYIGGYDTYKLTREDVKIIASPVYDTEKQDIVIDLSTL